MLSHAEIVSKLEYFCVYQERCHAEVVQKLYQLQVPSGEHDAVLVHLITRNFLNEERFAKVFAQSKFHQKKWGKKRIAQELQQRQIGTYLIDQALKDLNVDEYDTTFEQLSSKIWDQLHGESPLKKKTKFCNHLLRKGWEASQVYARYQELEQSGNETSHL